MLLALCFVSFALIIIIYHQDLFFSSLKSIHVHFLIFFLFFTFTFFCVKLFCLRHFENLIYPHIIKLLVSLFLCILLLFYLPIYST